MKRSEWVLVALLAVQLLLLALLWGRAPEVAVPKPLLAGFDPAKITRIELGTKPAERLVLKRDGSRWIVTSADGFPADSSKVSDLLDTLRDLKVGAPVVTGSRYHDSLDISDEKARGRIALFAGSDSEPEAELVIGSPAAGGSHVRLAGKNEVYEAKEVSYADYEPSSSSWIDRKITSFTEGDVTAIEVTNENGSFSIAKDGTKWAVTSPAASKGKTVKSDKASELARAVATVSADAPAGKVDPAAPWIAKPAVIATITVGTTNTTLRLGGHPADNTGKVYLSKDGFPFVVTVWESTLGAVEKVKLADIVE